MRGVDDFDWGVRTVEKLFCGSPSARLVVGFTASFDAGTRRARVQANIKLGVLVVAAFMHFAAGRTPTFTRDFLYREGQG